MSNTRFITAIVAFVATFIFSAGLVRIIFPAPAVLYVFTSQPQQYTKCKARSIEYFIRQDNLNGDASNQILKNSDFEYNPSNAYFSEYADSVADYVKTSANMDVSRFPQDFQNAWREHMKAWNNYSEFLSDMKSPSARRNLNIADFRTAGNRYDAEISRTYYEVLRVGRNYGADVE